MQGKPLSLTVHRSGPAGGAISLQGAGSSAGLLVPDIPVCGVGAVSRVVWFDCPSGFGRVGSMVGGWQLDAAVIPLVGACLPMPVQLLAALLLDAPLSQIPCH